LGSFRGSIAEISLEDILYEYRNSDTCVVSIATGAAGLTKMGLKR
jgi:hypothetical protein